MNLADTDQRLPLYARLRDALAAEIASQKWAAGASIPPEHELAGQFGVSVHTVRRAVQQLVDEGLLDRKQGSGTFVRRPSFDGSLFRWFNFKNSADNELTVPESRLLLREIRKVPEHVAPLLEVEASSNIVYVQRLRLWSGEPMVLEELYLPSPRYDEFVELSEHEIGPLLYPTYERFFGDVVSSVVDEISIGYANAEAAKRLRIDAGSPVVHVDRTTQRADGTAIEWRRAYGRADRFRYRVKLR